MNNQFFSYVLFFGEPILNPIPYKVYEIKSQAQILRTCNQRGFYKIFFITGNNIIRHANNKIENEGTNLFFVNAYTTYNWEFISKEQKGYACILTKDFLKTFDYLNILQHSRLFGTNSIPFFLLKNEQKNFITSIFEKMISEKSTKYIFRDELMYNWISLIMHEALKIKTSNHSLPNRALVS
jgi:hypothetical protein